MTVKELIEILKDKDPNHLVLVRGYEGGYDDVSNPREIDVVLDYHIEWYYGKHEDFEVLTPEQKENNINNKVKGLLL